jgi:hypothetical protein
VSEALVWPDDLREQVKSIFGTDTRIKWALRNNDSELITLLNERFGWECTGIPARILELCEKVREGMDFQEGLEWLSEHAERAAKIEELRQEAWAIVNNLVEGQTLLAHRPWGSFK